MSEPTPERWLPVPGYEGLYDVSDWGNVWSYRFGRLLKPALRGRGKRKYPFVLLHKNGKRTNWYVHTLVLLTFVGPRPPGLVALHGDDVATNNHRSNLRWGTDSENKHEAVTNGRNGEAKRTHCDNGHEFTEANTRWYRGYRCCRQCKRENEAKRRADPVLGPQIVERHRVARVARKGRAT